MGLGGGTLVEMVVAVKWLVVVVKGGDGDNVN